MQRSRLRSPRLAGLATLLLLLQCTRATPAPIVGDPAPPLLPGQRSFELLGGRLTVQLPERSGSFAFQVGAEAAPPPVDARRTVLQIPLEAGTAMLIVEETYLLAGPTNESLLAELADPSLETQPTAENVGQLRLLLQNPQKTTEVTEGQRLINSGVVVLPDQTIVRLGLSASAADSDLEAVRALARVSLHTLRFRHALKTGGTIEVQGLRIPLPDGWIHVREGGSDFSVDNFHELTRPGEPGGDVGLYRGAYPSYQHDQATPPTTFATEPGAWLSQPVTWHVSTQEGRQLYEAMIEQEGATRHVWWSGPTAEGVVNAMQELPAP